jgi:hypothetical protein
MRLLNPRGAQTNRRAGEQGTKKAIEPQNIEQGMQNVERQMQQSSRYAANLL